MRKILFALATAAPLLLAGCTFLKEVAASSFQKPSLTFKDARLGEISLAGATVNLVFDVDNPNAQGLSLGETDYLLKVEGKQLVAGKPPDGFKIPGKGHAEVVLPASVKFAELGQSLVALLSQKSVAYDASGHIGVDTPIGLVALPFQKTGRLDLPTVPQVSIGSPSLSDVSLTSAVLRLPITISNGNAFALPLGAIAGTLNIAGSNVGAVETKEVGTLAAQGKQTVDLPVRIRFTEAFAAAKAIRSGAAHVDLQGELRSGGAAVPFRLQQDLDLRGAPAGGGAE